MEKEFDKKNYIMRDNILIGLLLIFFGLLVGMPLGAIFSHKMQTPTKDVETIVEYQPTPELSEWSILQMAIIKTESEFNHLAVGQTKDLGLYQLTPIYVEEVNRILKMKNTPDSLLYNHLDAFDMRKSMEMFDIMQRHYNPTRNVSIAVLKHNPGGNSIGYAKRVHENIELMTKWEEVRKELLKYQILCTDR